MGPLLDELEELISLVEREIAKLAKAEKKVEKCSDKKESGSASISSKKSKKQLKYEKKQKQKNKKKKQQQPQGKKKKSKKKPPKPVKILQRIPLQQLEQVLIDNGEYTVVTSLESLKYWWGVAELTELGDEKYQKMLGKECKVIAVEEDDDTAHCDFGDRKEWIPVQVLMAKSDAAKAHKRKKESLNFEMAPKYDPVQVEAKWDEWWEKKGYYKPEMGSDKEKFVMMIPPPNVTGSLHLGHALMLTVEDAIVRFWRMKGKNCLWLPGTDHAGIATQSVVERMIAKDGLTRHDLGREKFLEKVWEWKHEHGGKICKQVRKMGSSVDWDREVFTMDPKLNKAVVEAFVRMFDQGKIYRDDRLCNWSSKLRSAISDAEVDKIKLTAFQKLTVPHHKKKVTFGMFHKFAYKVKGMDDEVVVATTRLETMLGDTAVAIHPKDQRYKHLHGKFVVHPFFPEREVPIILDEILVDMEKGTGAVKITPAHDPNDFEAGQRHKLPFITILDEDGKINKEGGEFSGQWRYECRENLWKVLEERGLARGKDPNPDMALGICSRSGDVIEPRMVPQWWVNCTEMAKRSTDMVRNGKLRIRPDQGKNTFLEYLDNIRPWCISRQLWWGHRIPAYLVDVDGESLDSEKMSNWVAARNPEEALRKAQLKFPGKKVSVSQDEDVLDTWFSSGLFPFSTLGWPDNTEDMKEFFPGHLLETGGDIIFFWVARMVMMSLHLTDQLPFTDVFLHPMVRDKDGSKMSKSKGNVIDPLHIINSVKLETLLAELTRGNLDPKEAKKAAKVKKEDYPNGIQACGADALRFGLLNYLAQGRSINLDVDRVIGWRNFAQKVWQAQSFVNLYTPADWTPSLTLDQLAGKISRPVDYWLLNKLNVCITAMNDSSLEYEFAVATTAFYEFFQKILCDNYLEICKPSFPYQKEGDAELQDLIRNILHHVMEVCYRLLHPSMPFITEELWQRLPGKKTASACIVALYPEPNADWAINDFDELMEATLEIITAIRSTRAALNIPNNKRPRVYINSPNPIAKDFLTYAQTLASTGEISIVEAGNERLGKCASRVINAQCSVYLELEGMVDFALEIRKITKKIGQMEAGVEKLESTLSNERFLSKAKPEILAAKKNLLHEQKTSLSETRKTLHRYEEMSK